MRALEAFLTVVRLLWLALLLANVTGSVNRLVHEPLRSGRLESIQLLSRSLPIPLTCKFIPGIALFLKSHWRPFSLLHHSMCCFRALSPSSGTPPSSDVFIVHTSLPSVIHYDGDIPGFSATAIPRAPASSSHSAASPADDASSGGLARLTRPRRPDVAAAHVRSYIQYLESQHFDIAKAASIARDKIFYR